MSKLVVINLFGGPGAGKSTLASYLYYKFKKKGYNIEYVPEFAKDLVYQDRNKCLLNQPYVTMNQYHKIKTLEGTVDYVVTDSPILLGVVYDKMYVNQPMGSEEFKNLVYKVSKDFININVCLERIPTSEVGYQEQGRVQSEKEAKDLDQEIMKEFRNEFDIKLSNKISDKQKFKIIKNYIKNHI